LREMFHATTLRDATLATPLYNRGPTGYQELLWCHYHFPEIKSSEL
jgi:hypothetical protein